MQTQRTKNLSDDTQNESNKAMILEQSDNDSYSWR